MCVFCEDNDAGGRTRVVVVVVAWVVRARSLTGKPRSLSLSILLIQLLLSNFIIGVSLSILTSAWLCLQKGTHILAYFSAISLDCGHYD